MLRIQNDIIDWIKSVRTCLQQIARTDPDLARQLRRSSSAVWLNLCEGNGARGGLRRKAHRIALAEMRESIGALEPAAAIGFVDPPRVDEADRTQKILATLISLARPWEE